MAVLLSRRHERRSGEDTLIQCEVCGKIAGDVACELLLVGGQVIGSVLVARRDAMGESERSRVRDAVAPAAPILANQRNLALAETRAASDALTGLPNRRAADETLKRMTAQAARRLSPLAAVLLDLDHFKHINDLHGHEQGDKALAAVGQILSSTLRASDFAARYGGEESLVGALGRAVAVGRGEEEHVHPLDEGAIVGVDDRTREEHVVEAVGEPPRVEAVLESNSRLRAIRLARSSSANRIPRSRTSGPASTSPEASTITE